MHKVDRTRTVVISDSYPKEMYVPTSKTRPQKFTPPPTVKSKVTAAFWKKKKKELHKRNSELQEVVDGGYVVLGTCN